VVNGPGDPSRSDSSSAPPKPYLTATPQLLLVLDAVPPVPVDVWLSAQMRCLPVPQNLGQGHPPFRGTPI
jgi:hypothetical protein